MNVIERARTSGKCPPSLFRDVPKELSFEAAVAKVLDPNELILASNSSFLEDFKHLMQMACSAGDIAGDPETKNAILVQRRCIILTIVGATPPSSSSSTLVLQQGYLGSIKSWMDDILSGSVGGVDLLLHLLSNIIELPVTKSIVKDSGMGKAIGSIEKHKICAGTPNEGAIKERVSKIKSAWNKSVKALKDKDGSFPPVPKRSLELSASIDNLPVTKKAKVEEKKSLSSLMKIMKSTPNLNGSKKTSPEKSPEKNGIDEGKNDKKKQKKRVKWHDHFGGDLSDSRIIEGGEVKQEDPASEGTVSLSERRKRDRLREKELLSKVKKAKLMDDDDDDTMGLDSLPSKPLQAIRPTMGWKMPFRLPESPDAPPPQMNSPEAAAQIARMTTVQPVNYSSDFEVPNSPAPMSDVEQALDMTNQSSTVTQAIPFFVPQQAPAPTPVPVAPAPAPTPGYGIQPIHSWMARLQPAGLPPLETSNAATPEFVQSLGLPGFLVGQDTQALKTLASTPSLLSTFVDSNGMYDQARLTSLVQTLSQSTNPSPQVPPPAGHLGSFQYQQNPTYAAPAPAPVSNGIYGPASSGTFGSGWHGGGIPKNFNQKSDEGNLHVSGYGPSTTQTDLINLFSPYVIVDEVVMKGNFSFVNTSDPEGASRARETLTGSLVGGMPIRINPATRRGKSSGPPSAFAAAPAASSYYGNAGLTAVPGLPNKPPMPQSTFPPPAPPTVPPPMNGISVDVSSVRDDRGNPATKNLFVAGYGQGTTEQQLRETFGQHAQILAIINKGSFSFVNTSDRVDAVRAREFLSGTMLNGGALRINFAKESGRLGTSFDVTYNSAVGGPSAGRGGPSYYGRS